MPSFEWISRRYHQIHYGWLIVVVCTVTMAIAYGVMYSFSVFFKPVALSFNWSRSTVSSIFSLSLIFRGIVSIAIGWLADRYGPAKLSIFCGVMAGLGLFLSSRVSHLWQFYITYGLIVSTGLSGAFTIGSAITTQWFTRGRGLALGFIAAGSGLGTLFIVPLTQRLIHWYHWHMVFAIYGIGAGLILTSTAFLLKPAVQIPLDRDVAAKAPTSGGQLQKTLKEAIRSKELIVLIMIFFSFTFCLQMIMIHLVNFATDIGVAPLRAAGFISLIGLVSIAGRLLIGSASDRIGATNSLVACSVMMSAAFAWLLFDTSSLRFYIFAILFGFAYGGQIPLIPLFVCKFFGTRAMAALIGLLLFICTLGGATGSWVGGKVYDITQSYGLAFTIAFGASFVILLTGLLIKRHDARLVSTAARGR